MSTLSSTLPASEARKNFYTMLDEVNTKLKSFSITLHGKVKAIVINPDELESWRETLDIMSNKKLVKELKQSQAEIKRGEFITEEELFKDLGIDKKDLD